MNIKSLLGKVKRKAKLLTGAMTAVLMVSAMSICASAEGTTSTASSNMASIVESAGEQLTTEFTNLVNSLVPVLVGISVVGLGIYAIIALFSLVKKFFKKAAG